MQVQKVSWKWMSTLGSARGFPGCEFPGITLRVDHSCSDKDVPFPESLHVPGGLQKVDVIHLSNWGKYCNSCPVMGFSLVMPDEISLLSAALPGRLDRSRQHSQRQRHLGAEMSITHHKINEMPSFIHWVSWELFLNTDSPLLGRLTRDPDERWRMKPLPPSTLSSTELSKSLEAEKMDRIINRLWE